MHAELIVPGLLSAPGAGRYPALELLLARGRRERPESRTLEQWLHDAFELPGGSLAAGALALEAAAEGWWARADPVHLRVLRDRAVVMPAEALDIRPDEAAALVDALNRHFGDEARFNAVEPRRWVVRLKDEKALPETPALDIAGDDAPSGGDQALLTEIQMLLHAHPVNEAREQRGEPAVNSVWMWGAGSAPAEARAPWRSVASADPSARGLARLAGMRRLELPESAEAWLAQLPDEGRHLAVLDALRAPLAMGDEAALEAGIAALERAWFAPLLAALRAERIGMVTVRVPDAAPGAGFETIRGDLRRIWRRPRPLGRYVEHGA